MTRLGYTRASAMTSFMAVAIFSCLHGDVVGADQPTPVGTVEAKQHAKSSHQGIWKSVVPPNAMHSEFDAHDPIGLAAGTKIKTDCSINWINPDNYRRYCFASGTSLVYFLRWPKRNANRAELGWKKMKPVTH